MRRYQTPHALSPEAGAVITDTLKWVPAEEGMQKAELALGDFATFG